MPRPAPPGWEHAPSATCAQVGEHALIRWITARLAAPPLPDLLVDVGDDAAVVRARRNHVDVLTTDVMVDGVHFSRQFSDARDIGHRALHVNLSDVAAMGGEPRWALLSLGLPGDLEARWVADLVDGLVEAASALRVRLIGGNISRSPVLFVDVTVSGAAKPRHILRRGGARVGDELYVSGEVGAAAAGLAWLQFGRAGSPPLDDAQGDLGGSRRPSPADDAPGQTDHVPADIAHAVARYRRPEARVALGVQVGRNKAASACMDTSDGLADALRQMAAASGVGMRVERASLPCSPAVAAVVAVTAADPTALLWAGGEDYELLFAVPRRSRRRFAHTVSRQGLPPVTRIGVCTRDADVCVVDIDGTVHPAPGGFEHFGGRG